MSKRINMISGASAQGGLGIGMMTSAGNPWTVADGLADDLVNRAIATYVDPAVLPIRQVLRDPNTDRIIDSSGALIPIGGGGSLSVQNDAAQVVGAAASIDFQGALRASGAGASAAVMIDQANVLQTPTPDGIPAYTGFSAFRAAKQRAIGLGGYPRRRSLMSWTDASSVNFRLVSGSGSVANDYTDPNFGEPYNASNAANGGSATNGKAIKLTWGANGVFVIGDKVTLPAPVDVTGKNVYVTFKILSGDISLLDLNVRLISNTVVDSGVTEANYHAGKCIQPYTAQIKAGVWQTMGIPIEAFSATGSGATLTAITHIYLHINAVAAGSLLIGDVFVCPRVLSRGVAIIGFDDCRSDTWMHAARYLRKYGMPGVLYPGAVGAVMRASVDQYQMTPAQLSHLQKRYGWQVASQAWSTENPDVVKPTQTLAQFAGELSAMDAFYADQGWEGGADGSLVWGTPVAKLSPGWRG